MENINKNNDNNDNVKPEFFLDAVASQLWVFKMSITITIMKTMMMINLNSFFSSTPNTVLFQAGLSCPHLLR